MIFSRKRAGDKRDAKKASSLDKAEVTEAVSAGEEGEPTTRAPGPFDVADARPQGKYLDLGAVRIPMVDGVEVRVQADPEGRVQQVALMMGDNGLQIAVLAAPRSEAMWDEVREGIRAQLRSDGFASQEVDGSYGTELRTRVRTPNGPTDLRFVGVNGPRWLVRAVFQGPVATDITKAPLLMDCLQGLIVDRGQDAMPAGDTLPLKLPKDIADKTVGRKAAVAAKEKAEAKAKGEAEAAAARRRRPATRRR